MENIINNCSFQTMLEFISTQKNLDKYDLNEIYLKSYRKAIAEKTQLSFSNDKYNVYLYFDDKYKVNVNNSLETEIENLKTYIKTKYNVSLPEMVIFNELHSIFTSYYFRIANREKCEFNYQLHGLDSLFHFLRYVVFNVIDKDLAEVHKFNEVNNLSYNCPKYKVSLGNLTIERLMNDKVYIKGLTPEQWAIIDNFILLVEKIR